MSGELDGLTDRPCMSGFAQVPAALYQAVSARARDLWGVLDIHQGGRADTHPSHEHLAEDLGWSVDTVRRALRELKKAGWVEIEVSDGVGGRGNNNRYRVLGRPGKRGRTAAFPAVENPRKGGNAAPLSAVDNEERGANLHRERGANLHPLTRGSEPEESSVVVASSTTDRARGCEHGRPLAVDGTPTCALCAEQRHLWPAAVGT